MHCRQCGYALWNLTEPRCPECGQGFDLRGYRFTPGTVGFACPHCGHLHGGEGHNHVPALTEEAICGGCGRTMHVAAMRVVPLVADAEAWACDRVPWEDRASRGFWRAWGSTWVLSAIFPARLGPMLNAEAPWRPAYGFALLAYLLAFGVNACGCLACVAGVSLLAASGGAVGSGPLPVCGALVAASMATGALMPLVVTVAHAGPAHLVLAVSGPRAHGFGVTARSLLYAQGPVILSAVPLCGHNLFPFAYLWVCVSGIFILHEAQRVSVLRAVCATLCAPAAAVLLLGGAYLAVWAAALAGRWP